MRMPDYTKVGDGPITIFLLHGAYGGKEYWEPQASHFASLGYRVISWDAPGYGISPLPENLTLETVADAAAYMIGELGSERNVIIGHSMGGIVTPRITQLVNDRVDALVISSAFASLEEQGEEVVRDFLDNKVAALVAAVGDKNSPMLGSMFSANVDGPNVQLVKEIASKTRPETLIQVTHSGVRYKGQDAAAAVNKPTLILGGRLDHVAKPEFIARLASLVPDAETKIFEGAAHYSFAELPDEFNGEVIRFLDRHGLKPV